METIDLILSKELFKKLTIHLNTNNKLSGFNRGKLEKELSNAKVLFAGDVPEDVVSVNRSVELLDLETGQSMFFDLVEPSEANIRQYKVSILSHVGVALVGYAQGCKVEWEMPEGIKTYRIQKVSPMAG